MSNEENNTFSWAFYKQFISSTGNPNLKIKKIFLFKALGAEWDVVCLYEAIQQISN